MEFKFASLRLINISHFADEDCRLKSLFVNKQILFSSLDIQKTLVLIW